MGAIRRGIILVVLLALGVGVFWLGRATAGVPASQAEAAREFWGWVLVGLGALFLFCSIILVVVLTWRR